MQTFHAYFHKDRQTAAIFLQDFNHFRAETIRTGTDYYSADAVNAYSICQILLQTFAVCTGK